MKILENSHAFWNSAVNRWIKQNVIFMGIKILLKDSKIEHYMRKGIYK